MKSFKQKTFSKSYDSFYKSTNKRSFWKEMLWGSGAIFFLRLLGSHRGKKISRWKNLFVFNDWCFLYQLVNLVLETCLIFSKILKLSKTFLSWVSSCSLITQTTSVMILLFQIIFRNSFQEGVISWIFGVFTKSIVVSILDFWHISFRKMFFFWMCVDL